MLSIQKYSSNVMEKFLEKGSEEIIDKFTEEICLYTRALGMKFYFNLSFFSLCEIF